MKRRRPNPDVPMPVLLIGAAAVGGAIVWWITRPKTNDVPVTARQPIAVSEPMAIMGGVRMDGTCPPGQKWGWSGEGRGGNAGCVPITVEPISDVQAPPQTTPQDDRCPTGQEWRVNEGRRGGTGCRLILSNEDQLRWQRLIEYQRSLVPVLMTPLDSIANPQSMEEARQLAERNLTPAQRAVFESSLEALNKHTSQLQATRPDRVREAALRGITERQVIEAARREYDSAYDELLRQAAQLK